MWKILHHLLYILLRIYACIGYSGKEVQNHNCPGEECEVELQWSHTTSKANLLVTTVICSDMKACLCGRNCKWLGVTSRRNTQRVNFFQLFRTWTWQVAFSLPALFPKCRKLKANNSLFCVPLNGITLSTHCLSSFNCLLRPFYFSFSITLSLCIFFSPVLLSSMSWADLVYVSQPEWPRQLFPPSVISFRRLYRMSKHISLFQ